MYWMQAEGFGPEVDADLLSRALGIWPPRAREHLERLVAEGVAAHGSGRGSYILTARGRRYCDELIGRHGATPGDTSPPTPPRRRSE